MTNAANLMKAIKDTLRASKLAMTLPNNYSLNSQTTGNTTSVATLCGPSQPPQLHGGRTHFQSPLNVHVGGTGSSTYPHPPHSTVFQPHVAPGGTNISFPLSPYTIATSTPPSVPSNAGVPIALGGEVLYPNSPHICTGTMHSHIFTTYHRCFCCFRGQQYLIPPISPLSYVIATLCAVYAC